MRKIKIGDKLQIHCYKHNGTLRRTCDEATVLDIKDDVLVCGNYKTKIYEFDDNGYLTDKENRFIWVKLNIKYNGRSSTKLNMNTSLYVKKNDKLVSYGSYLIESKELWLLPDSEEKVAGKVAVYV